MPSRFRIRINSRMSMPKRVFWHFFCTGPGFFRPGSDPGNTPLGPLRHRRACPGGTVTGNQTGSGGALTRSACAHKSRHPRWLPSQRVRRSGAQSRPRPPRRAVATGRGIPFLVPSHSPAGMNPAVGDLTGPVTWTAAGVNQAQKGDRFVYGAHHGCRGSCVVGRGRGSGTDGQCGGQAWPSPPVPPASCSPLSWPGPARLRNMHSPVQARPTCATWGRGC